MVVEVGGQFAANDLLEDHGETVGQILELGRVVLYMGGQRSN